MKNIRFIFVVAMLALLIEGCRRDEPGPNEVFMENSKFKPASITISVGTTVTWSNKERGRNAEVHTVTSNDNLFDSGDIFKNKTFSHTFNSTGTFNYHCKYHAGMTGVVIVK